MKVAVIVQARLGSSRLPRKMLLKLNGVTLIEFVLQRLQQASCVDRIIVATTDSPEDDMLESAVIATGCSVFRGSVHNVLQRYHGAVEQYHADVIVRICGDNPFLEISEITRLVGLLTAHDYDYVANSLPDGTHLILTGTGLAVEVFSYNAMQKMLAQQLDTYHQEHVTPYFYENPQQFKIHFSPIPFPLNRDIRLTMDIPEDYENIRSIYAELYPDFSIQRVNRFVETHPGMLKKMQHIAEQQKKGRPT